MPKRIQKTRTAPWRVDNPDAIIVDRQTIWGNPWRVGDKITVTNGREVAVTKVTPEVAVACYRDLMATRLRSTPGDRAEQVAEVEQWRSKLDALSGQDLVCWCALDAPCHADVLLELANPTPRRRGAHGTFTAMPETD